MLQRVGKKATSFSLNETIACPSKERPYFFTNLNSEWFVNVINKLTEKRQYPKEKIKDKLVSFKKTLTKKNHLGFFNIYLFNITNLYNKQLFFF